MNPHMIAVPLDMRAFNRWAADRGLVRGATFDEGFALHILLSSMFGKSAMQPFRLFSSPRRRAASLYAYADVDEATLRETAETVATPDCLTALDPQKIRSRPMRTEFSPNQRLGFDVRVRPVRRLRGDITEGRGPTLRAGAEVDAFVVQARRQPESPDCRTPDRSALRRESIYATWLVERLADAVTIDTNGCRLVSFRRTRALRGDGRGPEGPDATIQGKLTVQDPEAFARRVRHGIGRHRAYGYGMLLLRPPKTAHATTWRS